METSDEREGPHNATPHSIFLLTVYARIPSGDRVKRTATHARYANDR
jgi:hypothetical protein